MAKISVYGIPNCDTIKKARKWLEARGLGYEFHDYKKEGADPAKLTHWAEMCGWESLLNRRGTTFRKLSDAEKSDIDRNKALAMMETHPSMIKRPVAELGDGGSVLVGFVESEWESALC